VNRSHGHHSIDGCVHLVLQIPDRLRVVWRGIFFKLIARSIQVANQFDKCVHLCPQLKETAFVWKQPVKQPPRAHDYDGKSDAEDNKLSVNRGLDNGAVQEESAAQ
jgi:hypothetical protein